ncbi:MULTISPECIES: dicarboxylate transporter/tellurite-resistance protein TehA [Methylobacterium]|uniref:Tellurite resistance protein TehA n=1 Tax=Methylobacterium jeotgali TaxID=381630 RepID=A0ABQ4SRQ4_9HYPH|nr:MULTISPECIES: dicarboxylate transporter/tellurite-resistance protein TehA [Methylobacterium]PIU06196.1 MAG: dicarboxylate transporter/tellurite-resistance protein TehA [Methylobacterium sp. CG09_land_8_20_14_0_10_71_15]PIU14487.1 MAG: dicarboxylate transporter/tellurite-resistance protein TehA [Methylobacterium sp. CG08_land_8_20_14_0_20_71_15]GBU18249.1 dicarboxylate transporter/tellurite-resistance protein TehA [Methylobacterium sp.]GJE05170.1 Tellurite resistance protein TehA [Methylobact
MQVPATFFGMVLGLGGLGNGWRTAARLGLAPGVVGEALALASVLVWAAWLGFYALRWFHDRDRVLAEARDPTGAFFASLVPTATMIAAIALAPHWPAPAWAMALAGLAGGTLFAAWGIGSLWMGGRAPEATTPILYMPTVGGGFVAAMTCAAFGMKDLGLLFFGAGLLSWLTMESVVVHRLILRTLPVSLRASLGLHLAPPAVACVAYLAVTDGPPDRLAQILFGYALLHALVTLRMVPWLREQPFAPGAWAYTFGVSALPLAALRLTERGLDGPSAALALPLFAAANLIIGWIALRTLALLVRGRLVSG